VTSDAQVREAAMEIEMEQAPVQVASENERQTHKSRHMRPTNTQIQRAAEGGVREALCDRRGSLSSATLSASEEPANKMHSDRSDA